jgi:hypothetical protein
MTDPVGQLNPFDLSGDFNVTRFIIQQMLARARTVIPVQVIACTNSGGVSPFGLVNVQPLVRMIDGNGNAAPMAPVYNLLYFRIQGGNNAIICDPQPKDIGTMLVCDRDTSQTRSNASRLQGGTPGPANTVLPGSWRCFNLADGVYFGGNMNAAPTQYIQFVPGGGINAVDSFGNSIQMGANGVTINGVLFKQGATTFTINDHIHSNSGGTGDGGPPVSGS